MNTNVLRISAFTIISLAATPSIKAQGPSDDPVFSRYPAREALQAQVDQFEAEHTGEFTAALQDFALAVRSSLSLDFPEPPGADEGHGMPLPQLLPPIRQRDLWERLIVKYREASNERAAVFVEQYIEAITVDYCPALKMVCYDVLLNGWDDWGLWGYPKLSSVREKAPDLHKTYALELMRRHSSDQSYLDYRDAVGIVLPMILDASLSHYTREKAARLVQRVGDVDASRELLEYATSRALKQEETSRAKSWFVRISITTTNSLPPLIRRDFWADRLEVDDEWICALAARFVGENIRKSTFDDLNAQRNRDLANKLRQMAENNSSERIRRAARNALKRYEDSDKPPSHGITHHDGR